MSEQSYYGRPVIKEPIWKAEIAWYFFTGGLGGASAALAFAAGDPELELRAWSVAAGALGVSPVLLIKDLGVPGRFLNMLRMVKITSPMSIGTWLLSAGGTATGVAALHAWSGRLAAPARVARPVAALFGLPIATYTAGLIAQTAVPAWHEGRRELPFAFAASSAASAGGAAVALTPRAHAAAARRLTVAGAVGEATALRLMERRLGALAEPYQQGRAGRYRRAAQVLTAGGALAVARSGSRLGALAVVAGSACERFSVFHAGRQSAADPAQTIGPQRARLAAR